MSFDTRSRRLSLAFVDMVLAATYEVVVGTYEDFLVGYRVSSSTADGEVDAVDAVQSFATRAHAGSVKCAASAGRFLVSGGADDKIVVHDMKRRVEMKTLLHHDGAVDALAFAEGDRFLLSGGSDGTLCVIKTGNWQIHKKWPRAHKGMTVACVAVHPSDKLALTVGGDKTLRTWNLIKGRQAYVSNLNIKGAELPSSIAWSPDGERFFVVGYRDVDVWNVSKAGVENVLECENRSVCAVWLSDETVAVGCENGDILVFDAKSAERRFRATHSTRVKGLAVEGSHAISVSSSGEIKIWEINGTTLTEKKCVNAGCRITCMTVVRDDKNEKEDVDENEESVISRRLDCERENIEKSKIRKKAVRRKFEPYVSIMNDDEDETESLHKKNRRSKKKTKRLCR